jgi:hypothetical protein
MRRSEINSILRDGDAFIKAHGFVLPPFARLTPHDMQARRDELRGVTGARLGWDVTDYGLGNFHETGLFLFTLRNGRAEDLTKGTGMLYAEKLLISKENQLAPMHKHLVKAEDIINRGGARLVVELFASDPDGNIDESADVTVSCDGVEATVEAGGKVVLLPGESITLMPGVWHAFWAEGGNTLIGEVSTVNDDETDNYFRDPVARFSDIEEDEEPLHLLVSDYDTWLS